MKYSAWGMDGEASLLIQGLDLPDSLKDDKVLVLIKVFEAEDWVDANQQYNKWQGWENYKPLEDNYE